MFAVCPPIFLDDRSRAIGWLRHRSRTMAYNVSSTRITKPKRQGTRMTLPPTWRVPTSIIRSWFIRAKYAWGNSFRRALRSGDRSGRLLGPRWAGDGSDPQFHVSERRTLVFTPSSASRTKRCWLVSTTYAPGLPACVYTRKAFGRCARPG